MQINAEFDQRAAVHSSRLPWQASPMAGVSRRMLDRVGDEVARATTIVKYAPGSHFSPHVHTGGEEFIVLEGVFQDEHGDYPVGSYVRNPPTSSHTPSSETGCVIFVKLWQFDPADRKHVNTNMDNLALKTTGIPGLSNATLFVDDDEEVTLQQWSANAEIEITAVGGAELFLLEGEFTQAAELFARHSWLRLPVGSTLQACAGASGARLWMKTGHLLNAQRLRAPV